MSFRWRKGGAVIRRVLNELREPPRTLAFGLRAMYALDKTPTLITLATAIIAVAYVVFPEIGSRIAGGTLILTATFVAVVWTAHYTYRSVKHGRSLIAREDHRLRHERIVLLDAVLADLALLDSVLALPAEALKHASPRFLERPNLERAVERGHLLDSETARRLADFQGAMHLLERLILSLQLSANRQAKADPEALRQLDELMSAVRKSLPSVRAMVQEAKFSPV